MLNEPKGLLACVPPFPVERLPNGPDTACPPFPKENDPSGPEMVPVPFPVEMLPSGPEIDPPCGPLAMLPRKGLLAPTVPSAPRETVLPNTGSRPIVRGGTPLLPAPDGGLFGRQPVLGANGEFEP